MVHLPLTEEGATRMPWALRLPGSPRELTLQGGPLSSAPAAPLGGPLRGSSVLGSTWAHAGQRGQSKSQLCSRAGQWSQPARQPHDALHSQWERAG